MTPTEATTFRGHPRPVVAHLADEDAPAPAQLALTQRLAGHAVGLDTMARSLLCSRGVVVHISAHRIGLRRVLRVDGWLSGGDASVLESAVGREPGEVRLDLSGLRAADRAGLAALRRLRDAGAEIEGMSPYLTLSLDSLVEDLDDSVQRSTAPEAGGTGSGTATAAEAPAPGSQPERKGEHE